MTAQKAIAFLERVQTKQEPVPFTRFTDGVGHKPGMAAGRYPINAAKEISGLIKSAVANAANQGFGEELKIVHICAHKAGTPMHQGRQRRRVMKRTHIEIVLKEMEEKQKPAKKTTAKQAKKSSSEEKNQNQKATATQEEVKSKPQQNQSQPATPKSASQKVEEQKLATGAKEE
jgi:ribosomal protein L22